MRLRDQIAGRREAIHAAAAASGACDVRLVGSVARALERLD
jgi:hypothetical protein